MPQKPVDLDFHHPYDPYEVQNLLMQAVYDCLEQGKVGIFESPTGTGKSLSLICSSLTWLRHHKRQIYEDGFDNIDEDADEPDWMVQHANKEKRDVALRYRDELESRLMRVREREKKAREKKATAEPLRKRIRLYSGNDADHDNEEAQFALDDYETEDDTKMSSKAGNHHPYNFSAETEALMAKLGMRTGKQQDDDDSDFPDQIKIFYCSRTHSQLTQFADELKKVHIPPALAPRVTDEPADPGAGLEETLKHLTLGSRKNLCINPKVNKLSSPNAINERCLDLQQPKTLSDRRCPYLPSKDTEALTTDFRDHALAEIRDIEDLGALGKRLGICPYYASRQAIKPSEIVTLPYPLLLQKSAREALGISIKDHVIIIDEAHNLMDAITGIYSISVSVSQLQLSRGQLGTYLQKFRNKLKGKNRVYVTQIVRLLDSLITYLQQKKDDKNKEGIAQVGDLLAGKAVDQINLFKLTRYLQDSKLARKVDGYTVHIEQQEQQLNPSQPKKAMAQRDKDNSTPVLTRIQSFLLTLMNPAKEGRFFYVLDENQELSLKYLLLDPTYHFKDIVEEARAVVLAGGTMSPMQDYKDYLLSYLPEGSITTLSCGHVIASNNLMAIPVVHSINRGDFEFTFEKRNSDGTIQSLGEALLRVVPKIPDGVVVFFPSYAYMEKCITHWQTVRPEVSQLSIWKRLSALKPIFHEPNGLRSGNSASLHVPGSQSESILSAYSNAIAASTTHRGALLLSVIGGTLSEGINFSDALGRCVIVVGLPYPNPHSAEWKARLSYITEKTGGIKGKEAAREYYENACMRAVNQSVGRAIRHKNDYAAILVIDKRYNGDRIRSKLPKWIGTSLMQGMDVSGTADALQTFFERKHEK